MRTLRLFSTLVCICGLVAPAVSAQLLAEVYLKTAPGGVTLATSGDTPLSLGHAISLEIKGGAQHSFKIDLLAGQYVSVLIEQHGVILKATLRDPSGQTLVETDNPAGGHGPIYVSTIAEKNGECTLELRSVESWSKPGQCEVVIEELRTALAPDEERFKAERAFAEGRERFNQGTSEARTEALNKYKTSLLYWEQNPNAHWQVTTLYALAVTYRRLGQLDLAADYFERSLNENLLSRLDEHDWRLKASILNDRGLNYADLGHYQEAIDSLNKAFALYEAHRDQRGQASVFNNRGYTYYSSGDFQQAIENYERAIPLRRAENDQAGESNVIGNIAAAYLFKGEPHLALDKYRDVLHAWEDLDAKGQLKDPDQIATGYNNLAAICDSLGQWQQTLEALEHAWSKLPNKRGRVAVATLDNTGEIYNVLGDSETAMKYYKQALELFPTVKDPEKEATVLTHIAQIELGQGHALEALPKLERAFTLRQSPRTQADALTNLGAAYAQQQDPQKALTYYDRALQLLKNGGDNRIKATTLSKTGEAYSMLGNHQQALQNYREALVLWRGSGERRGEATTLRGMARAELDLNNLDDAGSRIDEAVALIESLRTEVASNRLRASYFATQQDYYEVSIDLRMRLYRQDQSIRHLAAAFQASEKSRARSLIDTLREGRTEIRQGVPEELLKRASEVQQRLTSLEQNQIALLNRRHTTQQAATIEKELNELIREDEEIKARISLSNPKYAKLTQLVAPTVDEIQKSLDDNTLLVEYSLGESRSYLWAVTSDSIHGFELEGRKEIEGKALRLKEALTERNREVKDEQPLQRRARLAKAEADYSAAAASLSELLLGPLKPFLGPKRWLIVADGALQLVPFAVLPVPPDTNSKTGDEGALAATNAGTTRTPQKKENSTTPKLLIDEHEIINLASASVLAVQRQELAGRETARHAVAVIANPVFTSDDPRLGAVGATGDSAKAQPGARKENSSNSSSTKPTPSQNKSSLQSKSSEPHALTRALRDTGLENIFTLPRSREEADAIMKVTPKGEGLAALDFKASKATAMSAELAKYRIVHFATHGVLDLEHPELSGMLLSMFDENGKPVDGYLRLHDIYNLNLPADLVVLSACETGIGKQIKGEGLIALTRGFMYAGAKNVVASLWRVDDAATAALMKEFYKEMFTNKLMPAAALRQAQLTLSKTKLWHSPFYWAGFVIQGDWK